MRFVNNGLAPVSSIKGPLSPVMPAQPSAFATNKVLPINALNVMVRNSHITAAIAHANMPRSKAPHS